MATPLQFVIGLAILLAPGFAAVWAFVPKMDWAKTFVVGVIAAASIPPATMYVLNVFLGVPFTLMNVVLIDLTETAAFAAYAIGRRLEARPHPA